MHALSTLCPACNRVTPVDLDSDIDTDKLSCSDRISHRCHHCQNALSTPFSECNFAHAERVAA